MLENSGRSTTRGIPNRQRLSSLFRTGLSMLAADDGMRRAMPSVHGDFDA